MIDSLLFSNVKGSTGKYEFAKLTVFTGRNFAGKTTVRDALLIACLGYHPALAKTNKGTFQLASSERMLVEASAGESKVSRLFELKGKTIKAEHGGDINEETKEWNAASLAVLKPELFISCSAKDRLRMLASLSGKDAVKEAIDAVGKIATLYKLAAPVDLDGIDALANAIEKKASDSEATIKRLNSTLATFADLDADSPPAPPVNLEAAMKKARDAARSEQNMINELAALESLANDARRASDAMGDDETVDAAKIESRIATARDAHAAAEIEERAAEQVMSSVNSSAAILEREIATLRKVPPTMPTMPEVIAEMDFCEMEAPVDESIAQKEFADCNRAKIEAQTKLKSVEDAAAKNLDEMRKLDTMEGCPTCKNCAAGWKDAASNFYEGKKAEIELQIAAAASAVMAASNAFEQASRAKLDAELHNKRLNRLDEHRAYFDAQRRLPKAGEELTATEKALSDAESRYGRAQQAEIETAELVSMLEGQLSRASKNAVHAHTIAICPKADAMQAATENAEAATDARIEAEREYSEAQAANEKTIEQGQRFQQAKTAREQLATAEGDKKKYAADAVKVRDEMERAVKTAYEPIIKTANLIGDRVMKKPLDVHEGEIGVWYDAFVPFEIISGTEQLIALAAIQAALSSVNGGIVIIDEFSRVDTENKMKLADNLAEMQRRGTVEQVIIFDHDARRWKEQAGSPAGWNVIEVA